MSSFKRWTSILISLSFIASTALALSDDLQSLVLDGNIYGHSDDSDFTNNSTNKVAVVSKDSVADVLATKPMRNGAYAVQIRITQTGPAKNKDSAHVGETVWVYYAKKNPWMTLKDKVGNEIQDPEKALSAKAQRDGESLRAAPQSTDQATVRKAEVVVEPSAGRAISSPTAEDPNLHRESPEVRKTKTEGVYCPVCETRMRNSEVATKNYKDLKAVPSAVPGAVKKQSSPKTPHVPTQWDNYPLVSKYSNSTAVKNMINYGMTHKLPGTKHRCYHYVKDALTEAHPPILSSRPPSVPAKDAMFELKPAMINMMEDPRYKDLIKDPSDAPKGAVLVYSNQGLGHIEIKTGDGNSGGYVSDFYNKDSILGNPLAGLASKHYQLTGVFIEDMQ